MSDTACYLAYPLADAATVPSGAEVRPCGRCGIDLIFSPTAFARAKAGCDALGISLPIRCPTCAPLLCPDDVDEIVVERVVDDDSIRADAARAKGRRA